ncbi:MAG: hypothetical protein JXR07_20595, partial [Reichenbachiella sp.]
MVINHYPKDFPDDVWQAKQAFLDEENPKKKEQLREHWKKLQANYEMDDNHRYIKDDSGQFVK